MLQDNQDINPAVDFVISSQAPDSVPAPHDHEQLTNWISKAALSLNDSKLKDCKNSQEFVQRIFNDADICNLLIYLSRASTQSPAAAISGHAKQPLNLSQSIDNLSRFGLLSIGTLIQSIEYLISQLAPGQQVVGLREQTQALQRLQVFAGMNVKDYMQTQTFELAAKYWKNWKTIEGAIAGGDKDRRKKDVLQESGFYVDGGQDFEVSGMFEISSSQNDHFQQEFKVESAHNERTGSYFDDFFEVDNKKNKETDGGFPLPQINSYRSQISFVETVNVEQSLKQSQDQNKQGVFKTELNIQQPDLAQLQMNCDDDSVKQRYKKQYGSPAKNALVEQIVDEPIVQQPDNSKQQDNFINSGERFKEQANFIDSVRNENDHISTSENQRGARNATEQKDDENQLFLTNQSEANNDDTYKILEPHIEHQTLNNQITENQNVSQAQPREESKLQSSLISPDRVVREKKPAILTPILKTVKASTNFSFHHQSAMLRSSCKEEMVIEEFEPSQLNFSSTSQLQKNIPRLNLTRRRTMDTTQNTYSQRHHYSHNYILEEIDCAPMNLTQSMKENQSMKVKPQQSKNFLLNMFSFQKCCQLTSSYEEDIPCNSEFRPKFNRQGPLPRRRTYLR